MRHLAAPLVLLFLGACAYPNHTPPVPMPDHLIEAYNRPLICEGKDQCNDWWRRAQYFVSTHAGMKIQTSNDMLIETFNAPTYSQRWAFSIRREPLNGGKDRIWASASCGEVPLCGKRKDVLIAEFNLYVRGE